MCKYEFKDTSKCKEEAFENSEYCILHMKGPAVRSPEDRRSEEYKRINGLKNAKVKEKIRNQILTLMVQSYIMFILIILRL